MAIERPVLVDQCLAGSDFSTGGALAADGYQNSGQYLFVKMGGEGNEDNTVFVCSSHGDSPYGVMQDNPVIGDAGGVMTEGITKVVAGANLVAGQEVGTNQLGQAVPKNPTGTGANYGDFVRGIVKYGAAAGALATITLDRNYRIHV